MSASALLLHGNTAGRQKLEREGGLHFFHGRVEELHLPCFKIQFFFQVSTPLPSFLRGVTMAFVGNVLVCKFQYSGSETLGCGENSSNCLIYQFPWCRERKTKLTHPPGILNQFNDQVDCASAKTPASYFAITNPKKRS